MKAQGLWFRVYCNVADCAKLQTLPPELFKAWLNFCCLAKRHGDVLPSDEQIAWELHITPEEAARQKQLLIEARLVEKAHGREYKMHGWEEFQKRSDNSTPRVEKHRQKQFGNGTRNGSVTAHETTVKRPGNAIEQEREREQEQEQSEKAPPSVPFDFDFEAGFHEFWELFPKAKRTHIRVTQDAYLAAVEPAHDRAAAHEKICSPLRPGGAWAQSEAAHDQGGKFFPSAKTYLQEERWGETPPAASEEGWINAL